MNNLKGKFKREILSNENIVLQKNDNVLGGKKMKMSHLMMFAVTVILAGVMPTKAENWQLYSITGPAGNANLPNTLITVNHQTGEQIQCGSQGATLGLDDLDVDPISGFLFGANGQPGIVIRIDPHTGQWSEVATHLQLSALAFSPTGTLYGVLGRKTFGTINLGTSTFSKIATLDIPGNVAGMDFSPQGSLYMVDNYRTPTGQFRQWVRVVDTSTGSIISTRATGTYNVGDIDFAPDGYIYHTNFSWCLIKIDPSTGIQTIVGFGNLGPLLGIASVSPDPPSEPWSFVQMTDLHIGKSGADDMLLDAVDKLNNMSQKPDFVLVTGDIVDSAWIQIDDIRFPRGAFDRYVEIMSQLDNEIEHYEVPGNHDRYVYGYDDFDSLFDDFWYFFNSLDLSQYCAWLPGWISGGHYYNFEHNGLMFVGLDSGQDTEEGVWYPNNGKYHRGTGLTNPQMNWLRGLDQCVPKVVFMHHPTINSPLDEWTISQNQLNFIDYCKNKGNNVKLVLAGHTHNDIIFDSIGSVVSNESTNYPLFTQTPAMCDGFYRRFNVSSPPQPEQPSSVSYRSKITSVLYSHSNMHVFDSVGRHVGINTSGNIEREIPKSYYLRSSVVDIENQSVTIFPEKILIYQPTDDYFFEVEGYEKGTYKLDITFRNNGEEATTFEAIGIPTLPGARHVYAVNWAALSAGEEGVTLTIDVDGDGIFERTVIADEDLTSEEYALQTETAIDFEPDVLNLNSQGKFITIYIELPEGFDVSNIDVSSLKLNELVSALSKPIGIGDYDEDGIVDSMVKFNRQEVIKVLGSGIQKVTLTGLLFDGRPLAGKDFIRVMGSTEAETVEPEYESIMTEESISDLEDNLQTTKDDTADKGGGETFDIEEAAAFMLFEVGNIISELGPESFSNEESAIELANEIEAVFTMMSEGMLIEALVVLESDILEKTDGCANIGEPDKDDWITSFEAQALVYPLVVETIELLRILVE